MAGQWDRRHTGRGELVVDPFEQDKAIGTLFGHRVWRVCSHGGWLKGHYFQAKWMPGENTARCLQAKSKPGFVSTTPHFESGSQGPYDYSGIEPVLKPAFVEKDCPGIARGDHGCGFYVRVSERFAARGESPYPILRGCVEAWGQVELGDKGFRASKARIVALVKPAYDPALVEDLIHRENDIRYMSREVAKLVDHLYGRADIDHMEALEKRIDTAKKINERKTRPVRMWPEVVRRYPDAEVFETEAEMLEAYPPTDLTPFLKEEEAS